MAQGKLGRDIDMLLMGVLCQAVRLVDTSGAFTYSGMRRAVREKVGTGWRQDEVDECLAFLCAQGYLRENDKVFTADGRLPVFTRPCGC